MEPMTTTTAVNEYLLGESTFDYLTTTEFPVMEVTNLTRNLSLDVTKPSVKTQLALYDILIPSLGAFILLLNLLVVISSGLILKKGQQPRATYLFLGNVAMTDLITGVAVIFGQLYPKQNRDVHICSLQIGMIVASTLASVYSVGLIAIDRFLYILYGIQYQQWVYPTRARLLIVGTWIIGCIVGFLPLMGWRGDTDNGRICWFILLAPRPLIVLTVIIGIIPLLLVIILYSIILYHAIKKTNQLQNISNGHSNSSSRNLRMFRGGRITVSTDNSNQDTPDIETPPKKTLLSRIFRKQPTESLKGPSKWKAVKVVAFTTGSFVITWSPFFIASLIYAYQCDNINTKRCKSLRIVIASPLAILGFANSLINPIIYAWWHKGFRTYVQKRMSVVMQKARRASNAVVAAVATTSYNLSTSFSNNSSTSSSRKMSNISNAGSKRQSMVPTISVVVEESMDKIETETETETSGK